MPIPMEDLIRRAVVTIRRQYSEPLSLDDLARTAMLSKFYFLRKFQDCTGITPFRFLSAVRMHEAKRLLFGTSDNVSDICIQVGYGSPGTFTRRFTECVGLSPTLFRRLARGDDVAPVNRALLTMPGPGLGTVRGRVTAFPAASSPIFVGLFRSQLPRGLPVARTVVAEAGFWHISGVSRGSWHLIAAAGAADRGEHAGQPPADRQLLVSEVSGVHVSAAGQPLVNVTIRPLHWACPPILVAMPGVDRYAFESSDPDPGPAAPSRWPHWPGGPPGSPAGPGTYTTSVPTPGSRARI